MSAPRDLDRLLKSYLKEGPLELPDPSYDEVRDRMEHTRQRAFIGSWRTPDMNRYLKVALAAAAVVVIAVVGINLLPGSSAPGNEPSSTPEPSSPEPSARPSSTPEGLLPEGPYRLFNGSGGGKTAISVTISAPGWYGGPDGGIILKNNYSDPPDGAVVGVFAETNQLFSGFGDLYVYGDPCHWETTKPDTPVTTVDEAVTALASQASRDASTPVDITVGEYAGKSITLHVPDDARFADCDQGQFRTLIEGPESARYAQAPGQIDEFWIVDVGDALDLVIFDMAYYEGTPQAVLDEMEAIVESATVDLPV